MGKPKHPFPRKRGEPISLEWVKKNCALRPCAYLRVKGPCWIWLGSKNHKGYAVTRHGKETMLHRITYRLAFSKTTRTKVLDHLCRTRACVNPHHFQPVTIRVNTRRGLSFKGKKAPCVRCGGTRISKSRTRRCLDCRKQGDARYRTKKRKAACSTKRSPPSSCATAAVVRVRR